MKRHGLNRRTFLRGMFNGGAVALALPWFEMFLSTDGTALASGEPFPKRFGQFFWGNGVLPARWVPASTGSDWELSEQLMPLSAVKNRLTVVSGMSLKIPNAIAHESGASAILTGAPLLIASGYTTFPSATIDQIVAGHIGGSTPFRSIELGAGAVKGISYNGPENINPPETSPHALFDRLFGGGFLAPGPRPGAPSRASATAKVDLRTSVLDRVMEDARTLRKTLGKNDQARLDQHLQGIRDLERRLSLQTNAQPLAACLTPAEPALEYPDTDGSRQLSAKNRDMIDILAMALACDQTRVFSNCFTDPRDDTLYPETTSGHHRLTHDEPDEQPQVNAVVKRIMSEFAYLVAALAAIPEGSGSLLDNTLIFATSDCSRGREHTIDEYPILLAGSAGGRIRQNFHYRSPTAENASSVSLSILHALDIAAAEYGAEEGLVNTGLHGIEV